MADYSIYSEDLDRVLAKYGALNFTKIAQTWLTRALILGQNELWDATPVWVTANLSQNWYFVIDALKGTLANRKKYGLFVHEGTSPHWAPKEALEDWAQLKGIPVRALQVSIARKGTKANPFAKRAFEEKKNIMIQEVLDQFSEAINNF